MTGVFDDQPSKTVAVRGANPEDPELDDDAYYERALAQHELEAVHQSFGAGSKQMMLTTAPVTLNELLRRASP